jgi:hypothetical protein
MRSVGCDLAYSPISDYSEAMIDAAQIEQMSVTERLQAMELLWKAISSLPEQISSPAWHGDILAERKSKIKRGEAKFLSIDQVKKRLQKRRK